MESNVTAITPNQLWIPGQGMSLESEYPTPTPEELVELWREYDPAGSHSASDIVYGVVSDTDSAPTAIVSVDVCEVLRQSHEAYRRVEDLSDTDISHDIFMYGSSTLATSNGPDIVSILQVLINNNQVPPVDNIDIIADELRAMRSVGALVVANTSTLPGCEPGTIAFFNAYLKECFDGVLFPRNHDGTLPATKASVIRSLHKQISDTHGESPSLLIHIDDAPHHHQAFTASQETVHYQTELHAPYYPLTKPHISDVVVSPTPLSTFLAVGKRVLAHAQEQAA